ncbi:Glycosyltransferase involved in cell wall bisynthesis [Alcanivorax sp. DSM 26295]|nr:Glycosyltransferase involved in cell wall bisynthesis [Alcanivorax sp. DSM 26295]
MLDDKKSHRACLFVTWDGPGSNYVQSLFRPIFERTKRGFDGSFHVCQFYWGDEKKAKENHEACNLSGISFDAYEVKKDRSILVFFSSLLQGVLRLRCAIKKNRIKVIISRGIIASGIVRLATLGLRDVRVIYHSDGLMADERVDFAGLSRSSWKYKFLLFIERQAVRNSAMVLSLTRTGSSILFQRHGKGLPAEKFILVSNGRDPDFFKPIDDSFREKIRRSLGLERHQKLYVYAGSLDKSKYHVENLIRFFKIALTYDKSSRLLILTPSVDLVESVASQLSLSSYSYAVKSVSFFEVPKFLSSADVGICLVTPAFSMQAVWPIKAGEYLMCGLPIISTKNVGDLQSLPHEGAFFFVDSFSDEDFLAAVREFNEAYAVDPVGLKSKARNLAMSHFDIEKTAFQYRTLINKVIQDEL